MLGTIVNALAISLGSLFGILLKKGIPEKISDLIMKAVGLCIFYVGFTGALEGKNTLVMIISMALGAIIGGALDLDDKLIRLGNFFERKLSKNSEKGTLAEGFVTASLLFCVGAMAIVGPLQSGLLNDNSTLFTKSILDGISSIIFASQFGFGVILSALAVILYQGSIALLAQWVAPLLSDAAVCEMTCVGSLLIIGISFNMIGITKLKVMNFVPAIFLAPCVLWVFDFVVKFFA